jgi:hypothetical protein
MNYKKILEEGGFPLSFATFGKIVCLTPKRLREIYLEDQERFYNLLAVAIGRWKCICVKVDKPHKGIGVTENQIQMLKNFTDII